MREGCRILHFHADGPRRRHRTTGAAPAPAHGRRGRKGHLHVGGIDLLELAEEFGSGHGGSKNRALISSVTVF